MRYLRRRGKSMVSSLRMWPRLGIWLRYLILMCRKLRLVCLMRGLGLVFWRLLSYRDSWKWDIRGIYETLTALYASRKKMLKMPVRLNNHDFTFSPGRHNQLQKAVIEEFAPRFAPCSECLYVGDTIKRDLVKNSERLAELGFDITLHDKMPDIVLYREDKHWIYFVESVTSVGAIDPKRIIEIESMTANVSAGKIFVTAFLDFASFKKFSEQLAWETEVWIADMPDHMIHLDGDKFLGPR